MKVIILIEFNRKNCNLNFKSHNYKIKTYDINFRKYPSKSIYMIVTYKPAYT